MISTSAHPFRPTLAVRTNGKDSDLIRLTITEKGSEHSLTMHRGCWLELLEQAEGVVVQTI